MYCSSSSGPPRPLITTTAIMPGRIVIAGASSFGNAPISGVRRAADRLEALSARWTSAKLVVQYPNDCTNPSPNTIAIQFAPIGFVVSPIPRPFQEWVASGPRSLCSEIASVSPS